MKNAAKILLYIGIGLFGFIGFIYFVLSFCGIPASLLYLIFVAYAICIGIILPIYALKRIDTAKSKKDLQVWGIIILIFSNLVAGILILLIDDEELNGKAINNSNKQITTDELSNRLEKLRRIKEEQNLTDEEYNELKKKVIDDFINK